MKKMIAASLGAGIAVLVAIQVAFGQQHRPVDIRPTTASGDATGAAPLPRSCVFPSPNDLDPLIAQSDLVIVGSIAAPPQVIHYSYTGIPSTRYAIRIGSVVRSRAPLTSAEVTVEVTGGVTEPLLHPGRYVLFLVNAKRRDGLVTYWVAGGLDGAFALRNGKTYRECANYQSPANRIQASGESQGMPEITFVDLVRGRP